MKVAVINYSGNVGKSTIGGHLFKPRLNGAPIFSIETINQGAEADGLDVETMKGKKFGQLINEVMVIDDAIVDVGSSNVEDFLKYMQQQAGSHEEFDYFVVPVVKEKKAQADTINTIRALNKIGVGKKKIKVIFNKMDTDETVADEFPSLLGYADAEKAFIVSEDAVIHLNEVYERLKSVGKSLADINADTVDYRAKLKEATTDEDKEYCANRVALKRLAITANKNLDDVFRALFGK